MRNRRFFPLPVLIALTGVGCGMGAHEESVHGQIDNCCVGEAFQSKATAYFPGDTRNGTGYHDRRGKKVRTLQDFLDGKASYVSIALDKIARPYGTKVCIPELERKYGTSIPFRIVDTGGAFKNTGHRKVDICVRDKAASRSASVNGMVTLVVCDP